MFEEDGKRPRLLIADDEAGIREVLRAALCESYECVEASSAEEALELLRREKFDLILSDIQMNGMSGLEMVPHALRHDPDTVVVMLSAELAIESAIEAMRAGAFDYVTKPFDLRHVEAAVRRALEHRALREAKRRYEVYLEEMIDRRTAEVAHLSHHDALTGLPNRVLFEDRLSQALLSAERGKQRLAVLSLDLDRFKNINDTLGPAAGDELLRRVAERVSACVREGDSVARYGSDEFALLLTQVGEAENVIEISRRILEAFKQPFRCDGYTLYLTTSAGVSIYPEDGEDAHTLLKNAGAALHRAKRQEGNVYQLYTADLNAKALRRLTLENYLRQALEREEFEVHYQPQVKVDDFRIVGAEALVRWQHPELGMVSPAEFIPLAEETGLIVQLGEWILRSACEQIREWRGAGASPLRVAVNLSPRQFRQPDLIGMVWRALAGAGLDAHHLELELTESSVMTDPQKAAATLRELRLMGVGVAIDDFGTGYSSLSHLKSFPLTTLKVDKSFLSDAATDPADAAIVRAIVALARSLDLRVKAEGVETGEQLELLRALGCDEAQGYLFSRPLPAQEFARLLPERGRRTARNLLPFAPRISGQSRV